jgi:lysozyme
MNYAVGEDRSAYQAVTGWAGNSFGFAKATEGSTWVDPAFAPNWANLGRAGIVRGAYHFFHPALDAAGQAQFFVSTVESHGGYQDGDVFLADVEILAGDDGMERWGAAPAARMNLPLQQGSPMASGPGPAALVFLNEVSRLVGPACPVLLYTDLYMAQHYLAGCAEYPLFLAYYEPSPPANVDPWPMWVFWQHEQGGGRGGGDADWFNGDETELAAWRAAYNWTGEMMANLPTLQQGSADEPGQTFYVHRAQALVAGIGRWNKLGTVTAITDDGVFGAGTKAAVAAVQKHFSLTADGVVGQETWEALIG